jgi:phosphopantetheinyl transferase
MPIFFQHKIDENTRLGIWKIEETEDFFKANVPLHRHVTHPHKRLQHLAGRFLLQYLFPDFPYALVQIADTRKPFLPDEQYHFSISHCGDYAAAIVSKDKSVWIDIEVPAEKISRIMYKFLSALEHERFELVTPGDHLISLATLLWSAKESVFKWYGNGAVDFRKEIQLNALHEGEQLVDCKFTKTGESLPVHFRKFQQVTLAWVMS